MNARKSLLACLTCLFILTCWSTSLFAQTAPTLGTAQSFGVLGASTVTNTGPTVINGDLGVSPGNAITGFPPGVATGTLHAGDAAAAQAQSDATTAYNFLAGQPCNTVLTGQDLGGLTLVPGVYCFASTAQLTGTLTLNGQGNAAAIFIFKVGSTLMTASTSAISLINGATACNVFFQVGSSATLGTGTQLSGSIFALASITLGTNSTVAGRAIALNGAVTLDSNTVTLPACAGPPRTGFVQVCKVAGMGVTTGTNFSFNVGGTVMTVPAGAAPAGSCGTPVSLPVGTATITETIPAGVALAGVSTLPDPALLISSDLAAGTANVTVTAGGQTIVTFVDAAVPVPTTGFVQVCKVAGAGVAVGTNFSFNAAGTAVTVAAGAAPLGRCGTPVSTDAGTAVITETLPAGVVLSGVSTLPTAGLLVSSNLGAGTATVTVAAGATTIVTFIDSAALPPANGSIQVCKIAGAGVAVGTPTTFNVAGTPVTINAGAAPGGTCGTPITVAAGNAVVTETIPAGTTLASVSTLPSAGLLVSSNLATGTATVNVVSNGQTIVTFVDVAIPPANGTVQICKVAGANVAVGTTFSFNVGGTPITVAAGAAPGGTCGTAITFAAGPVAITETIPAGIALTGVSTLPSAALLVSSSLSAGTATVTVVAGGQTTVTFIDAAIPIIPTNGVVQVCKVAGAGITQGTNFDFNVGGTLVIVPAGPAPGGTCAAPLTVPAGQVSIAETIPANTVLAGVSTLPSAALLVSSNLAAGTAMVTVVAGGQTIVTFIDAAVPIIPANGFLQVCKVAGAGITAGTLFNFNVAGAPMMVAAGAAPGGTCTTPISLPPGPAVVTETIPAGVLLAGVSTLPSAALLVSSNLTTGTATVTVVSNGQTIVTFIDAAMPPSTGFVQVCKVAGLNVPFGTNFTFNVGGTPITVPAGIPPGGTCGTPVMLTVGNAVITETIPAGIVLTGVSTLPGAGLLVSSDLGAGTATVTVVAGGQTIVTFIDAALPPVPSDGLVQVCKVAGPGVPVGTTFDFNVGGNLVIVSAGSAPGGTCAAPVLVPTGAVVVRENIPLGTTLASVTTLPNAGLLLNSNLDSGMATITVLAGLQTIVTFVDTAVPIPNASGLLQVCKVAGAGITAGTNFTFNVAGTTVTVPAGPAPGGTCAIPVTAPVGAAVVTELPSAGSSVAGIGTTPAGLLLSSNLAAGTATVMIAGNGLTIVTFIDTAASVAPNGQVQVCKVAGTGVAVGTNFTFNVGGTPVVVPAGATPGASCSAPVSLPAGTAVVAEIPAYISQGEFQVRYAGNLGAGDSYINLTNAGTLSGVDPTGRICANIYTFDPAEELISCCACPITPNGLNSLSVRNDLISNTLTPGVPSSVVIKLVASVPIAGACNAATPTASNLVRGLRAWGTTLHASTAAVAAVYDLTETPFSAAQLSVTGVTGVTASPAGALLSSDLTLSRAVVTVNPGGQTVVTFTNGSGGSELAHLTSFCQFIQSNGSGYGLCRSCRIGALGASQK